MSFYEKIIITGIIIIIGSTFAYVVSGAVENPKSCSRSICPKGMIPVYLYHEDQCLCATKPLRK